MSEEKYIIRYKFGNGKEWRYSDGIINGATHSASSKNNKSVITMTLTEAKKYVKRIVKIRKTGDAGVVTKIQILNAETDEIMDNEESEVIISRFELMDI